MNKNFFGEIILIVLGVSILVFLIGLILFWQPEFQAAIVLKTAVGDRTIALFGVYLAISLAIESTIEIYLKVFRKDTPNTLPNEENDAERSQDSQQPDPDVKRIATIASLIVGIGVSCAGVRFLEPFFEISSLSGLQVQLFHALDILLTAGLLSGGSDGIHQATSLYRQRINQLRSD